MVLSVIYLLISYQTGYNVAFPAKGIYLKDFFSCQRRSDWMSQRVKTSAHGLVLPRQSPPENDHLRKNTKGAIKTRTIQRNWQDSYVFITDCSCLWYSFTSFLTKRFPPSYGTRIHTKTRIEDNINISVQIFRLHKQMHNVICPEIKEIFHIRT